MKEKVFTDEQLNMLADCILSKIKSWQEIGDRVQSRELTELVRVKSVELHTLLNYITVDMED